MKAIDDFLKTCGDGSAHGYCDDSAHGYGDGRGSGYGNGDGSGHGYGCGDGSGNGSGSGFGDGYGICNGNGSSDGSGYGRGDGSGYGRGDGSGGRSFAISISVFDGHRVFLIDGISTIIAHAHGNFAKGFILHNDFTLRPCYVVRNDDGLFAHGDNLREAMEALQDKEFDGMDEDARIDAFIAEHEAGVKYSARHFFDWHHKLTGSCNAGRKAFCINHGIDLDSGEYTVDEFIKITRDDYGASVIRALEKRWVT